MFVRFTKKGGYPVVVNSDHIVYAEPAGDGLVRLETTIILENSEKKPYNQIIVVQGELDEIIQVLNGKEWADVVDEDGHINRDMDPQGQIERVMGRPLRIGEDEDEGDGFACQSNISPMS